MLSSWPRGRFRRSWPRWGGNNSLSPHLEPNLHCPAGSKRPSGPRGMVTESARRLDSWTDAAESRGRRRQGVVMLISGVKGYQNPTKHPPLLVLLELSSVAKRLCASKPPPTSPLCVCVRMYFGGLPTSPALTCAHPSTALLLPPRVCSKIIFFLFLH